MSFRIKYIYSLRSWQLKVLGLQKSLKLILNTKRALKFLEQKLLEHPFLLLVPANFLCNFVPLTGD